MSRAKEEKRLWLYIICRVRAILHMYNIVISVKQEMGNSKWPIRVRERDAIRSRARLFAERDGWLA